MRQLLIIMEILFQYNKTLTKEHTREHCRQDKQLLYKSYLWSLPGCTEKIIEDKLY